MRPGAKYIMGHGNKMYHGTWKGGILWEMKLSTSCDMGIW